MADSQRFHILCFVWSILFISFKVYSFQIWFLTKVTLVPKWMLGWVLKMGTTHQTSRRPEDVRVMSSLVGPTYPYDVNIESIQSCLDIATTSSATIFYLVAMSLWPWTTSTATSLRPNKPILASSFDSHQTASDLLRLPINLLRLPINLLQLPIDLQLQLPFDLLQLTTTSFRPTTTSYRPTTYFLSTYYNFLSTYYNFLSIYYNFLSTY